MIGKAIVFFAYALGSMLALNVLTRYAELGISFHGDLATQGLVLVGAALSFMVVYALTAASIAAVFSLRSLGRIIEVGVSAFAAVGVLLVFGNYLPEYVGLSGSLAAIIGGAISSGLVLLAGTFSHPFAWFHSWLPVRIIEA